MRGNTVRDFWIKRFQCSYHDNTSKNFNQQTIRLNVPREILATKRNNRARTEIFTFFEK